LADRAGADALIVVEGNGSTLVARMRGPLMRALAGRGSVYAVWVEALGPRGDVLVTITGSRGRIPLVFAPDELQPPHVARVVRGALDKAAI